jgi:hypothetical protein
MSPAHNLWVGGSGWAARQSREKTGPKYKTGPKATGRPAEGKKEEKEGEAPPAPRPRGPLKKKRGKKSLLAPADIPDVLGPGPAVLSTSFLRVRGSGGSIAKMARGGTGSGSGAAGSGSGSGSASAGKPSRTSRRGGESPGWKSQSSAGPLRECAEDPGRGRRHTGDGGGGGCGGSKKVPSASKYKSSKITIYCSWSDKLTNAGRQAN